MKKKFLLISSILLTLIAFSGQVWAALSTTDTFYLGSWIDGAPANPTDAAVVINELVDWKTTTSVDDSDTLNPSKNFEIGTLPDATADGAFQINAQNEDDSPNPDFSTTGIIVGDWDYILAKYDGQNAGSLIWYIGEVTTETIDIPPTWGPDPLETQYAVSNYILFNAVPLPSSFLFFGSGLLGLASFSRRRK